MGDQSNVVKGTYMRGPDNEVYFVPDDKLQAFRVPAEQGADVLSAVAEQGAQLSDPAGVTVTRTDQQTTFRAPRVVPIASVEVTQLSTLPSFGHDHA